MADAATGAVRDVLEETVSTFYESGNGRINWRYLPASNEVIWFSERDNWGQLYLFDLQTGKMKPIPILLFGREFWSRVVNFEALCEEGTVSPADLDLITWCETAEEAWEHIAAFYEIGRSSDMT